MTDDHGDNGRQRPGVLLAEALPDSHEIHEHPERHVRIAPALVFEHDVHERLAAVDLGGEQQVALTVCKFRVDERTGLTR